MADEKSTSELLVFLVVTIIIGIAISKIFANTQSQVMAFILLFGMILFFS